MHTKLAVHWQPEHTGPEDFAAFRTWQPRSIKIVDPDAERCRQALAACPNALFVLRDHPLSEQKADMAADPAGTGKRHAQSYAAHVPLWRPAGLPLGQIVVTGINEPDVNAGHVGAIEAAVNYNVAFLDELARLGLHGGALNLSVGWPDNHGRADAPPDWAPYEPVHQAIRRGGHYLVLHEYWPHQGPGEDWRWLAGRFRQCPWPDVRIVIGECGLDQGVAGPTDRAGWLHWLTGEQYVAQLAEYDRLICQDPRIHSAQVFTWDYRSSNWAWHDVRRIWTLLADYGRRADWPGSEIQPPPAPEPQPAPTSPAIAPALLRPLSYDYPDVSQWFGETKADYSRFGLAGHNGIDYPAPQGAPVMAAHGGRCALGWDEAGYGNFVEVHSGDCGGYKTVYAHLSAIVVQDGQMVAAGAVIGKVGSTGNSTASHLHWGLKFDRGQNPAYRGWVDPRPFREGWAQ